MLLNYILFPHDLNTAYSSQVCLALATTAPVFTHVISAGYEGMLCLHWAGCRRWQASNWKASRRNNDENS